MGGHDAKRAEKTSWKSQIPGLPGSVFFELHVHIFIVFHSHSSFPFRNALDLQRVLWITNRLTGHRGCSTHSELFGQVLPGLDLFDLLPIFPRRTSRGHCTWFVKCHWSYNLLPVVPLQFRNFRQSEHPVWHSMTAILEWSWSERAACQGDLQTSLSLSLVFDACLACSCTECKAGKSWLWMIKCNQMWRKWHEVTWSNMKWSDIKCQVVRSCHHLHNHPCLRARTGAVWGLVARAARISSGLVFPSASYHITRSRKRTYQWIGLRENLQENPIFNGKINGFL